MTEQPKKLSRRDAIKLIGAAAGASVLATLPTKWTKPEITTGVLPAHAQTSISAAACVTTLTIYILAVQTQNPQQIGIAQGPIPSSQTPSNYLTTSPSGLVTIPQSDWSTYRAVWCYPSGCLQLAFGGYWGFTVTGPNPTVQQFASGYWDLLIDLATGLFDTSFNNFNNPPGSCGWT